MCNQLKLKLCQEYVRETAREREREREREEESEGAMAVKWKAEWRREEGEKGGKNSQGKERRCGKEGGWMRFSQAANMLSRSTTLNNVMAGSQQKHLYLQH